MNNGRFMLVLLLIGALFSLQLYTSSNTFLKNSDDVLSVTIDPISLTRDLQVVKDEIQTLSADLQMLQEELIADRIRFLDASQNSDESKGDVNIKTSMPDQSGLPETLLADSSVSTDKKKLDAEKNIEEMDEIMLMQLSDQRLEMQASDDIHAGFAQTEFNKLSLDTAYCRGSMCRLEVSYEDPLELDKLFSGEAEIVPWSHKGRAFNIDDDSGILRTVFFLTRQ